MIVDYSPATGLTLAEPDDFNGFKLRLRQTSERRPKLPGIIFVDDGNALVAIETVNGLAGAPASEAWAAGFGRMVDHAATRGWIDASANAIRAHVERIA